MIVRYDFTTNVARETCGKVLVLHLRQSAALRQQRKNEEIGELKRMKEASGMNGKYTRSCNEGSKVSRCGVKQ